MKYWVHSGFLTVNKEKMSKSLRNFFTIKEALKKYEPDVIRFFMLNALYRSPMDLSEAGLEEAANAFERIRSTVDNVKDAIKNQLEFHDAEKEKMVSRLVNEVKQKFMDFMDDDFNTREAITVLFEFTKNVNQIIQENISKDCLNRILNTYKELGGILGLFQDEKKGKEITDDLINLIVDIRENARKIKDWETSDKIRNMLKELGIIVEDSENGAKVKCR